MISPCIKIIEIMASAYTAIILEKEFRKRGILLW